MYTQEVVYILCPTQRDADLPFSENVLPLLCHSGSKLCLVYFIIRLLFHYSNPIRSPTTNFGITGQTYITQLKERRPPTRPSRRHQGRVGSTIHMRMAVQKTQIEGAYPPANQCRCSDTLMF